MAGAATVEKALDVLFHLHGAPSALGLSEIGRALGLPKSSCHRLLAALVEREIVDQDEGGRYRPGLALLALGLGAQAREPVVRAARPILAREADALGETVFLVARRRGTLRVLDKCDGLGFLRAAPEIGDEIPEDVTAAGQLDRLFGRVFDTRAHVPGERSASTREADRETTRRGYALNRDAWIEGLSVMAVPIWRGAGGQAEASPGSFAASLALGAASSRFESLGEQRIAARLLAAAGEIGARLGAGFPRAADASSKKEEALP